MSVRIQEGPLSVLLEVEGAGVTFERERNGDAVEVCVEYDDSTWAGRHTSERYITISREDWNAIVAHVAWRPER